MMSVALVVAGAFAVRAAPAADQATMEPLMRELEAMKRRIEKIEQQTREQQEIIRKQSETIRQLSGQRGAPAQVPPAAVATVPAAPAAAPEAPPRPWSPSQPITLLAGARGYMNISFDALMDFGWSTTSDVPSIERGDHDPLQRGFTLPNEEIFLVVR
jgi:TolA-binding protein